MLDTLQNFETPEGVELGLKLAGPAARSLAWAVDALIKLVLLSLAGVLPAILGDLGTGLMLIYLFTVLWLYNVLFEVLAQGATPGKKSLRLRVVNANGTPVGWYGAIMRNLLRPIDWLPVCYGLGLASSLLNARFQRLGDLAAGTVVVYRDGIAATAAAGNEAAAPLRLPLSMDEQRAILAYTERSASLTDERAVELAEILHEVTGEDGETTARQLRAHGNWLVGRS